MKYKFDDYVREEPHLSYKVRGATMDDEEGNHNIYIYPGLSKEQKLKTLAHEVYHAEHEHLSDDTLSVEEKEEAAKLG